MCSVGGESDRAGQVLPRKATILAAPVSNDAQLVEARRRWLEGLYVPAASDYNLDTDSGSVR